ncbi:MAG TPA: methyltransferase domain-containing protein [Gaiellaceae bacterium]|nr:methyltransferase domain-containing protein [Gaiellaceae bacterium]
MTESDLRRVQSTWDTLAQGDDLFGVIWGYPYVQDQTAEEFFGAGEREIARVLARGRRHGLPRTFGAALDFGCGAGRLTQALARRFERVVGVDVAPAMIEAARALDASGGRAEFVLNEDPDLRRFADASFDLVYSNLVLQHMPPELAGGYVAELVRVLAPGGLLVFQAPSEKTPLPRLPRSAVLAELEPLADGLRVPAGAQALARVRVRNASGEWWSPVRGRQMIELGNHWLDERGRLLVQDDGRADLGQDFGPGHEAVLELVVTAPSEPGRYLLELDMVQQDVGWFARRRKLSLRRSRTARLPVEVGGEGYEPADADPATASEPVDGEPKMEMHPLPRAEVERTLAGAGARLFEVEEDDGAGPGWLGFVYWVTR